MQIRTFRKYVEILRAMMIRDLVGWRAWFFAACYRIVLLVSLGALGGCIRVDNQLASPPPVEVGVAQPLKRSIRPLYEVTGSTEAYKAIQVRSRVRGFIDRIYFTPGASVNGPEEKSGDTAGPPRDTADSVGDTATAAPGDTDVAGDTGVAETADPQLEGELLYEI